MTPLPFLFRRASIILLVAALSGSAARADIQYDGGKHCWSLVSGPVQYQLAEKDGTVALVYFGPVGQPPAAPPRLLKNETTAFDLNGRVEGQLLEPESLQLTAQNISQPAPGQWQLLLTFKHRYLPLEIKALYTAWGDTGVFTRKLTLTNTGAKVLHLDDTPSIAWLLPGGDYALTYLHGSHGDERQVSTEMISWGVRSFVNQSGRSTNGFSPWFCLENKTTGVRYAGQLAYSGNWQMSFQHLNQRRHVPLNGQGLWAQLGMRFDFGGPALLQPGAAFEVPGAAFTASKGDLDDIANQMHRYQAEYVIPKFPGPIPLLTQVNTFMELFRHPTTEGIKKYADIAEKIGMESVAIDAGWVTKYDGKTPIYGDWKPDPVDFPKGMTEAADYVHSKGLLWGMWLEPEAVSKNAPIVKQHPEWILRDNGEAMSGSIDRVYLNFDLPAVRAWTREVVDRMVKEYKIDWLKIDFNVDLGERFDPNSSDRSGLVLYNHYRGLYAWIDAIRATYPKLIVENCSSGGLRMDLAMLSRTNFTWISDQTGPKNSAELNYGATLEFPPQACYHWTSGEDKGKVVPGTSPGWWDFMFRMDMNGLFGIGSNLTKWPPELLERAKENVALFKRIRGVITGADVYHLTPPPEAGENPTGWLVLQYAARDAKKSVVMAYRLGSSQPEQSFALRGLDPAATYSITKDGKAAGHATGKELAKGLALKLEEWRSVVVEITAQE